MCVQSSDSGVEYKDIPDFPGYRVGSDGSVWSCLAIGNGLNSKGLSRQCDAWHRLRPAPDKGGYPCVTIRRDGRTFCRKVHVLVLSAFVGPRPQKMDGCHNDGNRSNSRVDNLRWDTRQGNLRDRISHGTICCGDKNASAKLNNNSIYEIRDRVASGERQAKVAADFGVSQGVVSKIVNHVAWSHIE